FGGIWAALAMALWIAMLTGRLVLPTAFDPVSWHAHEMLFGYLGAIMAGFLLTAVPNWTGRLPIVGWPLAGLVSLWMLGRIAIAVSAHLPAILAALADLAFPLVLIGFLGREIVAGGNWRNLPVLALLAGWTIANAAFHLQAARGGFPAGGAGLRLGLAAAVMLISLIGGRIVPSFTRNWLAQQALPARPMPHGRADLAVLGLTLAALLVWVLWPDRPATAAACALAGLAHIWRLSRWSGRHTGSEALVWVLHAAYAFVPLGFLAMAAGSLFPLYAAAEQHIWMAGAIGLMTLAVMTRASLGHAGRPLHATRAVAALYLAVMVSVAARFAAGLLPGHDWLLHLAATAWIVGFGGFAVIYWPILTQPKAAPRRASTGQR
ncbi:MAG TPA: NnrS family protein, partial [Paracoccaceae bacterium]|nr:NnrS family protein [Paracoccaceae bacterium]